MRRNPFQVADAAEYEEGRPYFHPSAIDRFLKITEVQSVPRAADIGCGTGMSAQALKSIAAFSVGLDISEPMLAEARRRGRGPLVRGRAEQLPFSNDALDLVTVGLGLHWFERQAFLREVHRVLAEHTWLLIYDAGFCARLRGHARFTDWVAGYCERFPLPPREDGLMTTRDSQEMGFRLVASENLIHARAYDLDGLVSFVRTQSRVTFAVQEGRDSTAGAVSWLRETLAPLLGARHGIFEFDGWLQLLQKAG